MIFGTPNSVKIPWLLRKVIISRGGSGYSAKVDGRDTTTTEDFYVLGLYISRHLIGQCKCSFCEPHSLETWAKLPPPGRFEIQVPPADNRWKWTSFSWRRGVWQYYFKVDVQLFPSRKPFFRAERWA